MKKPLIQHISSLLAQYHVNEKRLADISTAEHAKRWKDNAESNLLYLAKSALPHGSGIDYGTQIVIDASNESKIVLYTSFHHMDEHGGYDGWTEHKVIVTPSFQSFDISISGRNRNGIKDYLYETFDGALNEIWEHVADENHPFVCPALVEASRQFRFQCVTNELLQKAPDKLTDENRQWIAEYRTWQAEIEKTQAEPYSLLQITPALQAKVIQALDDYINDIESSLDTDCPEAMAHDKERQSAIQAMTQELKNTPFAKG